GKVLLFTAVSANDCRATNGRNSLSIFWDSISSRSCNPSIRCSSVIRWSVPPVVKVEKISWKETSKVIGLNCSVFVLTVAVEFSACHKSRFDKERWFMHTPLGLPVDPDV